jgi:hypothetical protein
MAGKTRGSFRATPSRRDIAVYNEATGFVVTSRGMGGRGIDPTSRAWTSAFLRGDLLPIELVQDDSFVIRIVAGGKLSRQEEDEWVGRVSWILNCPDGQLVVAGGSEFLEEPLDAGENDELQSVRTIAIAPGTYRADFYTYLSGVNGAVLLERAMRQTAAETLGAYFRRTRTSTPFPDWLRARMVACPDLDPGYESEWKVEMPAEVPPFVDFLLHLTTATAAGKAPRRTEGWISNTVHDVRVPARCPLGLDARGVDRLAREAPGTPAVETVDVLTRVSAYALAPVDGGSVELPITQLVRAFRLAWFAHDSTDPEIRIVLPAGVRFEVNVQGVKLAAAERTNDGWRVGIESTASRWYALATVEELGRCLSMLPDGAKLELVKADSNSTGEPPAGLMRLRGTVNGGTWSIDAAFPQVDCARLGEALELSTQSEDERSFTVASAAEATQLLARYLAAWGELPGYNLRAEGASIRLDKPENMIVQMLARYEFVSRFGDVWTTKTPR